MIDFNKIQNGDSIETGTGEVLEVRYINRIEGWLEVSDEEDTFRTIVYPGKVTRHIPLEG